MQVYYGVEANYTDVTYICYKKLVSDNVLRIPASENDRCKIFGDPIYGTLKHIKIGEIIYTHEQEIVLDYPSKTEEELSTYRKNWWNTIGKFIESPQERLKQLHEHIYLQNGSMKDELPEQLMAMTYIKDTDTVLEIGGNIGRNSLIIASILDDDKRFVVLDSCPLYARQLEQNRDDNYFNFSVEASALSKVPLIQKGWETFISEIIPQGYTKVNTITFPELKDKYSLSFNVLVADCEGALYQILKDEPDLLETVETIVIENDFTDIRKKEYVHNKFLDDGFNLVYNQEGGWGPCYSCFFQVWSKN